LFDQLKSVIRTKSRSLTNLKQLHK